jgi:hypothetical protein
VGEDGHSQEVRPRTTKEVLDDHLHLADDRRWEEDIERNVSRDCVLLTGRGVFRG